jgi:hypothetical protein
VGPVLADGHVLHDPCGSNPGVLGGWGAGG